VEEVNHTSTSYSICPTELATCPSIWQYSGMEQVEAMTDAIHTTLFPPITGAPMIQFAVGLACVSREAPLVCYPFTSQLRRIQVESVEVSCKIQRNLDVFEYRVPSEARLFQAGVALAGFWDAVCPTVRRYDFERSNKQGPNSPEGPTLRQSPYTTRRSPTSSHS
jgi:hypothetical protein